MGSQLSARMGALAACQQENRRVAKDGCVSGEGSRCGVRCMGVGATAQVSRRWIAVEIWAGDQLLEPAWRLGPAETAGVADVWVASANASR